MTLPANAHIQALTSALPKLDIDRLQTWGRVLAARLYTDARLLVAGDSGTATEAQRLTSQLATRIGAEQTKPSSIDVHADTSSVSAMANDRGPEGAFDNRVHKIGRPGDVLLLLSSSGDSPDLLAAARAGRELGLTVWALTGPAPNPLADLSNQAVCVEATQADTVQECHLVAVHLLYAAIDTHASASIPVANTEQTVGQRLVVVGDVLLDRDITGTADRLSPEAPVPVLTGTQSTERPGGAGLAAVLAARHPCWRITLVCGIGQDPPGALVRTLLDNAGIEVIDLATSGTTPVKTRVRASERTLLRYDSNADPQTLGPLPDLVNIRLADAAAVLVCDYGRGITFHDHLREALTLAANDRPLVWDPHPKGATPVPGTALAIPNTDEAIHFSGHPGPRDLASDTNRARQLRAAWPVRHVAITRGRDGAVLIANADGHPLAVPTRPANGDTCGAGDQLAVCAAMTLAAGRPASQALATAVKSATVYVESGGPALLSAPPACSIPDGAGPLELAARVRARGERVVAASGCFDLLHAGHLSLLAHARRLGDALIVCIHSDAAVGRIKGENRPVVDERERAALLAALDYVDGVLVFDEDTPARVLAELRPDIWVTGGDFADQKIAEADLIESWGGDVVTVPFLPGHSTTIRIHQLAQRTGDR
ncbi:PfkB family carbohydrate kinase [Streptomyces sp. NPDC048508]|uniref:PfkB family carbohydrate kinase n=1 Tax=Streptomyces sp. NPDC048508 TaxID=3365561 RepID=UPI0037163164